MVLANLKTTKLLKTTLICAVLDSIDPVLNQQVPFMIE